MPGVAWVRPVTGLLSGPSGVSTPGRRVYTSVKELKPHRQGLGVSIVSTPQGVMTDSNAREKNVGGEVLCQVF